MTSRRPSMMVTYLAASLLASCATDGMFGSSGAGTDDKLAAAKQRLEKNPQDKKAKIEVANETYNRVNQLFKDADTAMQAGDTQETARLYGEVLQLDANNPRALAGLNQLATQQRHAISVAEAQQLFDSGNLDGARTKLRQVLIENPQQAEARNLMQAIETKNAKDQITPRKLKPPRGNTVTLEFRNANLQNIFEVISRTSGINFVFDPTINPDLKASIFVKDASVEEAIDFLLVMHQLSKKVLTENSLIIYPSVRSAQYEDLIMRTFYLNHADAKQTAALIKAMMPVREVFVDDKLNMISLKATYDQLRDVEKLINDEDMPDPEVVLDVEVLEVKRSRLTDLGLIYPNTFSVLGAKAGYLTWRELTHITPDTITTAPAPTVNLLRQDGDTNLLANPRIRVKNREKARIHIGDRIPIATTTISSSSNFASKSANYLDVGLKLDVEPRVMLSNDVSIKVGLEVSSATLPAGADFPTVSTRNTSTVMMSADGETQVLAGLINDEDRRSATKVPGLSDLPLLGHLFTNKTDDRSKTEIVLLITPHVVRNILRPAAGNAEFYGGTAGRAAPLNINPAAMLQSLIGGGIQPPAAAPAGQAAPASTPPSGQTPPPPPGLLQPLGKPIGAE